MAEYPEIYNMCRQMNEQLVDKKISDLVAIQPKCLNMNVKKMQQEIEHKQICQVKNRGKWIDVILDDGNHLMIGLGMGADILYFRSTNDVSGNYHCKLCFTDNSGFTCRFWWFGHVNYIRQQELCTIPSLEKIACSPFDRQFTLQYFIDAISSQKAGIKNLILNQKIVSGIGNAYIHDILFMCGIHPLTRADKLNSEQIMDLYNSIKNYMEEVSNKGGLAYEKDFMGKSGMFYQEDFRVGYKENCPCPQCGTDIMKIKTGSTSSYICPQCQGLI